MKTYTVSQELMQKFLNYLVSRPYIETYQLVDALKTIPANEELSSGNSNVVPLNAPVTEVVDESQETAQA